MGQLFRPRVYCSTKKGKSNPAGKKRKGEFYELGKSIPFSPFGRRFFGSVVRFALPFACFSALFHKAADLAAIDAAMTELNNAWQAASQDIYASQQAQQQQAQNAQGGAQQNGGAQGGQQQPEDVEFEEVK